MLPAIGAVTALNSGGRLGVMVDARPPAEPEEGRQLAAVQLKTVDQRDAQGQAAARVSGLAPLPAEATERPGATRRTLAMRDERAAAVVARLPERLSEPAGDPAGPIDDAYQRAPGGRQDAVGSSASILAAATSGDAAELQPLAADPAAMAITPTDLSARDSAVARLGHRLYAEAQSHQAPEAQAQSSPPESDPTQIGRPRGGRLDLTS